MGKFRICLDSGHTLNYNKGIANGYYEGNVMFTLTQYEAKEFENYENVEVVLTRNKITDNPSLATRGKMAKGFNLFISNHSNAPSGNNSSTRGVNVLDSVTKPNKSIAETIGKVVAKTMGNNFRGVVYRRGNKGDYYGVLRHSIANGCKCSLLIEHGFHTNLEDSSFLMNNDNLKKLAKAKVEIIAQIFGLKKKNIGTVNKYYRVRKSWADVASQVGAYVSLENAKVIADRNIGYSVFDYNGKTVYVGQNIKDEPEVDFHVVENGDTLWGIAHEYSMTVDELKKLNGLNSDIIHIGSKLKLNNNVKPKPKSESVPKKEVQPVVTKTGNATIRSIQSTLNSRYNTGLRVDGYYGSLTNKAIVKGLQTELNKQFSRKLKIDGSFGSLSRANWVTVKRGAKGNLTYLIQALLYCKGYKITLDSSFGGATKKVVKQFQKDNKLTVDGKIGKNTITALVK